MQKCARTSDSWTAVVHLVVGKWILQLLMVPRSGWAKFNDRLVVTPTRMAL